MPPTYRGGTALDPENVRKLQARGILFDNDVRVNALERARRVQAWRTLADGVKAGRVTFGFDRAADMADAVAYSFGMNPKEVIMRRASDVDSFAVARRELDASLEV